MQSSLGPILCNIESDKIFQIDYAGRAIKEIGVTSAYYQEALKVIQDYKEKLIKAGVFKKEKTPQELQEETNEMIKGLINKINILEQKVSENEHKPAAADNPGTAA